MTMKNSDPKISERSRKTLKNIIGKNVITNYYNQLESRSSSKNISTSNSKDLDYPKQILTHTTNTTDRDTLPNKKSQKLIINCDAYTYGDKPSSSYNQRRLDTNNSSSNNNLDGTYYNTTNGTITHQDEKYNSYYMYTPKHNSMCNSRGAISISPKFLSPFHDDREYTSMNITHPEEVSTFYQKNYQTLQKLYESIDFNDSKQMGFSPEIFYTEKQLEIYNRHKEISSKISKDQLTVLKRIFPKKKEHIYLLPNSKETYKIDCKNKNFPLKFEGDIIEGEFEIYFSKTYTKPDEDNFDMIYTQPKFIIYITEEISYLYFTIISIKILRMTFSIHFAEGKESIESPKYILSKDSKNHTKNKHMLSDFHYESLTEAEKNAYFQQIDEIKRKRKREMLALSNNKDLIKQNKMTISSYSSQKSFFQFNKMKEKNDKAIQVLRNKEILINSLRMKRSLGLMRKDFKKIENHAKNEMEKAHQEKLKYDKAWINIICLLFIMKRIHDNKTAIIALRILKKLKDDKCKKIQRVWRKYHEERYQENNPMLYTKLSLMSIGALWKKRTQFRSEKTCAKYLMDACLIFKRLNSFLDYRNKMILIQRRWRRFLSVYQAQVHLVSLLWDKIIWEMLEAESPLKKKKTGIYHGIIPIKEFLKQKVIKEFVTQKIKHHYKEVFLLKKTIINEMNASHKEKKLTPQASSTIKSISEKLEEKSMKLMSLSKMESSGDGSKRILNTNLFNSYLTVIFFGEDLPNKSIAISKRPSKKVQTKHGYRYIPKYEEIKALIEATYEKIRKEEEL